LACDADAQCQTKTYCNELNQCSPDGTGKECSGAPDCQYPPTRCDPATNTCVSNGTGLACDSSTQCKELCTPGEIKPCGGADCSGFKYCIDGKFWSACSSNAYLGCENKKCVCVSGVNQNDLCATDDDCNIPNQGPTALTLKSLAGNYCSGIQGAGVSTFKWIYSDPNQYPEFQFELQIDDNADFSSPEVDRIINTHGTVSSGSVQQQMVLVKQEATNPGSDYINYKTPYYWRVKVSNTKGLSSDWIDYAGTYTFEFAHPAPAPGYALLPNNTPAPGDLVTFTDYSYCYDSTGRQLCRDILSPYQVQGKTTCVDGQCYTWDFGDNVPVPPSIAHKMGDVTHTYNSVANYTTSLAVCDDIDCCYAVQPIYVGSTTIKQVPIWKEISPF
jgi:hypothetical protein